MFLTKAIYRNVLILACLTGSAQAQTVIDPAWVNGANVKNKQFDTDLMQPLPEGYTKVYEAKNWTVYPTRGRANKKDWESGVAVFDKRAGTPPTGGKKDSINSQINYKGKFLLVGFYANKDVNAYTGKNQPIPIPNMNRYVQCTKDGTYAMTHSVATATALTDQTTTSVQNAFEASISDALKVSASTGEAIPILGFSINFGIENTLTTGFKDTVTTSASQMNSRQVTSTSTDTSTITTQVKQGYVVEPSIFSYAMTQMDGIMALAMIDDTIGHREINASLSEANLANEYAKYATDSFPYVPKDNGTDWSKNYAPYRIIFAKGTWLVPNSFRGKTILKKVNGKPLVSEPPTVDFMQKTLSADEYVAACRGDFGNKNQPSTWNIAPAQQDRFCKSIGGNDTKPNCNMGPWKNKN
jgi:hypothetical protein